MKTTSTDRPEMRLWLRRPRPPYALLMRRRRSERKRGKREGSGSEEGKRGAYLCRHCPHSFCSPTRTFFCTMSNLVSSFNVDSMIARNVRDYLYPHYPARRLTICLPDNLSCFCARVRILVSFLGVRSVKSSAKGKKNDVRGGRHVRQVGRKLRPGCTPLYSLRRRAWLAGWLCHQEDTACRFLLACTDISHPHPQ